ncbi:MAG: DUF2029 domain-containing protein [Planctomycetes bacterium]|nr:DUF2029 domain-containing protein [Planctomycetota bacterium]
MNDTNSSTEPHRGELRAPGSGLRASGEAPVACSLKPEAYARTLLGKLDHRYLKSAGVRWVLAILAGLVLVVPSVQFVVKIQETEYSAIRQREKHRSAVGRWLPDARALVNGENPYSEGHWFPNPPLVLMALVPFAYLPIVVTAVLWSVLKIAALVGGCWLVVASTRSSTRGVPLAAGPPVPDPGRSALADKLPVAPDVAPLGVLVLAALFSARPIMGDITHGNINSFVFFEIALAWYLFVNRRDGWAGVVVGLAVVTKVTPALMLVYFVYKRAWRVVAGAGLGLVLFAFLIPSIFLGFGRNNELLASWHDQMVRPYVSEGFVTVEPVNQSLPGMIMKWLSFPHLVRGTWIDMWEEAGAGQLDEDAPERKQLDKLVGLKEKLQKREAVVQWADRLAAALPTEVGDVSLARRSGQAFMARLERPGQRWIIRGAGLLLVLALAWACRGPIVSRRDPRLLLELSLVLLAMLLLSERTWKHHLVTLPIVYLATWQVLACVDWSARFRTIFVAGLAVQFVLLVLAKGTVALFAGVITIGLLLCFVQNAVLLGRLRARTRDSHENELSSLTE